MCVCVCVCACACVCLCVFVCVSGTVCLLDVHFQSFLVASTVSQVIPIRISAFLFFRSHFSMFAVRRMKKLQCIQRICV